MSKGFGPYWHNIYIYLNSLTEKILGKIFKNKKGLVLFIVVIFLILVIANSITSSISMQKRLKEDVWMNKDLKNVFTELSRELLSNKEGIVLTLYYQEKLIDAFKQLYPYNWDFNEAKIKFIPIMKEGIVKEINKSGNLNDTLKVIENIRRAVRDTILSKYDLKETKEILAKQIESQKQFPYTYFFNNIENGYRQSYTFIGKSGTKYEIEIWSYIDREETQQIACDVRINCGSLKRATPSLVVVDRFIITPNNKIIGE